MTRAALRWTLFGGSEQGPARALLERFLHRPGREVAAEQALEFIRRLLARVYGEPAENLADLRRAGFRILPQEDECWPLASGRGRLAVLDRALPVERGRARARRSNTCSPFGPSACCRPRPAGLPGGRAAPAALSRQPGVLGGAGAIYRLQARTAAGHADSAAAPAGAARGPVRHPRAAVGLAARAATRRRTRRRPHGPVRNTYKRTHRWARVHRDEDELAVADQRRQAGPRPVQHRARRPGPLRQADGPQRPDLDAGLSPAARRAQGRAERHRARGPHAGGRRAVRLPLSVSPPCSVGVHEVYWHRPLVAYLLAGDRAGRPSCRTLRWAT